MALLIIQKHGDQQPISFPVKAVMVRNADVAFGDEGPVFVPHLLWQRDADTPLIFGIQASWAAKRFSHIFLVQGDELTDLKQKFSELRS